MTDEQKPKNRARKRAIIARMAQAGEPFSVAARHVDAEHARKTAEPSAAESQRKQKHTLDDHSASHEPAADANAPLTPGASSLTSKETAAPAAMPPNPAERVRRPRASEDALRPRVGVGVGRPGPVALTAGQACAMFRAAETESPQLVQPEPLTSWRCRFEPGDYECRMAMSCDCRRER